MTNRGITVLALRLFVLFLVVYFLASLPELYARLNGAAGSDFNYLFVLHLLPLLFALLVWTGVGRLADWILPRRTAQVDARAPDLADVQGVAYSAVGLLLLGLSVPRLLPLLYAGVDRWLAAGELAAPPDWVPWIEASVQLVLGLWLLLGGRGLSGAVLSLRRAGVQS